MESIRHSEIGKDDRFAEDIVFVGDVGGVLQYDTYVEKERLVGR